MAKWLKLELWLLEGKNTDHENQLRIQEAKKHWHDLLERLISSTQFLAIYNLAFRGHKETLFLYSAQNSENVIDLVKLSSNCDPVL